MSPLKDFRRRRGARSHQINVTRLFDLFPSHLSSLVFLPPAYSQARIDSSCIESLNTLTILSATHFKDTPHPSPPHPPPARLPPYRQPLNKSAERGPRRIAPFACAQCHFRFRRKPRFGPQAGRKRPMRGTNGSAEQ